jgi:excisionase family DNA binding protein
VAHIVPAHQTSPRVRTVGVNRQPRSVGSAPISLPTEGDGLMTESHARAALQIGRSTLWRWVSIGRITPVRFGRMVRFRISDLRLLLAGDPVA